MQDTYGYVRKQPPTSDLFRQPSLVLLVEDECALRTMLCVALRHLGYAVLEAANTKEALRVWSQHQANIHLLITDFTMPDGNGLQLVEQLRGESPELRAIVCTGHDLAAFRPVPHGPPLGFLPKPFDLRSLEKAIREQWQGIFAPQEGVAFQAVPAKDNDKAWLGYASAG